MFAVWTINPLWIHAKYFLSLPNSIHKLMIVLSSQQNVSFSSESACQCVTISNELCLIRFKWVALDVRWTFSFLIFPVNSYGQTVKKNVFKTFGNIYYIVSAQRSLAQKIYIKSCWKLKQNWETVCTVCWCISTCVYTTLHVFTSLLF